MTRQPVDLPLWLRLAHWSNALATGVLAASGWRIYNAAPLYGFTFPAGATLGGWLGGALQWHFAAMWLLALNGLFYVGANLATGRAARAAAGYPPLQRMAYAGVVAALALAVLSGLVLYKPVQLPLLHALVGGYEAARRVHFVAMAVICAFAAGHVALALLAPATLLAMLRGRR